LNVAKIKLPPKVKCWKCEGAVQIKRLGNRIGGGEIWAYDECDCEDGERYTLGDLKRAADEIGVILTTAHIPTDLQSRESEKQGDYVGEILYAEGRIEAAGDSYEAAAVAVINKWNEEERDAS
jgi:hypothetical protein